MKSGGGEREKRKSSFLEEIKRNKQTFDPIWIVIKPNVHTNWLIFINFFEWMFLLKKYLLYMFFNKYLHN